MKIYSGDVGIRMDGEGQTLRSGDKDMLIDKIRHFAFILRESQKNRNKILGIECDELSLDDIEIVTDNTGETPQVKALICKNVNDVRVVDSESPAPTQTNNQESEREAPSLSSTDCSTLEATGLRGEEKVIITGVTTLAECCYKCQNSDDCEVAEFKEDEEKCELHRVYNYENEIANKPNSTLLGKDANTFDIPEEPTEPTSAPGVSEVFVPPGKSEWEIIKIIKTEKRTGHQEINLNYQENFVGSQSDSQIFRPSLEPKQQEIDLIQSDYSFNPTIVSLSSDPDGIQMPPSSSEEVEFSSHEVLIPTPQNKRYSYKIAVYQTGFCMDTPEKKRYLGIDTKKSDLGLGEIYSDELELGESIKQTIIMNKPPLMVEPTFKEPEVSRPVIKFFEPKEGDSNTIIRLVGLKLDEVEYFCFRDVKVQILKRQERIIGDVKYQEYLFKAPSLEDLDRKCWQSIEKYRVLIWGYHHGYQIISSEGADDKNKMFTYSSPGDCNYDKK